MSDDERIEWIALKSYAARYLADLDIQALENEGIPVIVHGEEAGIWGPAFAGPTSQGIKVMIPAPAEEEARELLELDREDDPGFDTDDEDDDPEW